LCSMAFFSWLHCRKREGGSQALYQSRAGRGGLYMWQFAWPCPHQRAGAALSVSLFLSLSLSSLSHRRAML
jgi:hypothetical protein